MSGSLFYGGTPFLNFSEFHATWSRIVNQNCLPLCRQRQHSSAAVPSTNIKTVLERLDWYYEKLDSFAKNDIKTIPYLLFTPWRNPLEMPILFLGYLHPYLLTSLFRSITNKESQDSHDELLKRIEDKVRDKVSVLLNQMSEAQMRFAALFSENWVSSSAYLSQEGLQRQTVMETEFSVAVMDEEGKQEMEKFANIFVEANLLRKEVIKEIVEGTEDHLSALFLEALFRLFVAFKDQGQGFQNSPLHASPLMYNQQHPPGPANGFHRPVPPPGPANGFHRPVPPPGPAFPIQSRIPEAAHNLPRSPFPFMNQQRSPEPAHFPPVPVPVPSNDRTLWIGDVKDNMDSGFLTNTCFAPYDRVVSAKVIPDSETGQRYGFIEFGTWSAANRALQRYNNAEIPGVFPIKRFRLHWSKLRAEYTIHVGNLSDDVTADVLGDTFRARYQSVRAAAVKICHVTRACQGYGFVSFSDVNDRIRAKEEMEGALCCNRRVTIGSGGRMPTGGTHFSSFTWN
ncbi:unnamed protein product [Thlaspi arvense]|uniref:RRM domain-containing protein n=1 Tax=Thlaspi arvense TaxID=13288 RepID=A0AAU9T210_THLAR|nr:unnamed protein product [Thlaspi arvense]